MPCSGHGPAACASVLLRVALTFQCVMVSCSEVATRRVKTTKTPNVCVEGILCRRVDYITKRDREAIILPHLQGGLTSLPI